MTENKTLTKEFLGTLPKFGFGLMRLPRIEGTEEIDVEQVKQMVDLFLEEDDILTEMCGCICANKTLGLYDGAYKAVQIAMGLKKN